MAGAVGLSGCTYNQKVSRPYPRWGQEFMLEAGTMRPTPLRLRLMTSTARLEARACVLLVHGMNEYIGRYREIAEHFASRYHAAGLDLYAHGLSNPVIENADSALMAGAAEAEVGEAYKSQAALHNLDPLRHDFGLALQFLLERCKNQPVFVVSHSLGSLVAASYLIERQADPAIRERIGGIVLLGPAFSVPDIPGWRGWLQNPAIRLSFSAESNFLDERRPWWAALPKQVLAVPVALMLRGLFEVLSWPAIREFTTPVTPDWVPDYLSDWEVERERQRTDGYIIRRTLLRFAKAAEREIVGFRSRMQAFGIPYLLIYSGHDPITAAFGNEDFLRATLANHPANESLILGNHSHHEHLFSSPPLRRKILKRIDDWLSRRLADLRMGSGNRTGPDAAPQGSGAKPEIF